MWLTSILSDGLKQGTHTTMRKDHIGLGKIKTTQIFIQSELYSAIPCNDIIACLACLSINLLGSVMLNIFFQLHQQLTANLRRQISNCFFELNYNALGYAMISVVITHKSD